MNAPGVRAGAQDKGRIPALDLVRGVAVLGILAVNLGGFAGPIAATLSPNQPIPGTLADQAWFAFTLVVFEGKMRALFTLLFGASMALFIERMDARAAAGGGRSGEVLQLRRLGWLLLFGYLHYALLWWGDILFLYALCGLAALALRQGPPRALLFAAIGMFLAWHATMGFQALPEVRREQAVLAGTAPAEVARAYRLEQDRDTADTLAELARERGGFSDLAAYKLTAEPLEPVSAALSTMGETLPLMLLGLALYRLGFFHGGWDRARLRRLAAWTLIPGAALTLAFTLFAWQAGFPPMLMLAALAYGLAVPHLLMAIGYAALLLLAAPALAPTRLGRRLTAAGRMAFSNYIAMTVLMTFIFYGWGLGRIGLVPPARQWPFLLLGWGLMLGWSPWWLARFRQGPLEWAWRCLTQGEHLPFRRGKGEGFSPVA